MEQEWLSWGDGWEDSVEERIQGETTNTKTLWRKP